MTNFWLLSHWICTNFLSAIIYFAKNIFVLMFLLIWNKSLLQISIYHTHTILLATS